MSDAMHLGETEVVQQIRREGPRPPQRHRVVIRTSDLLAGGTDEEVADVRNAPAPLAMKDAEDLIRRRELIVDPRVDAVQRILRGQREAQLARSRISAGRRRLRPDVQELSGYRADLARGNPIERHGCRRAGKSYLLARVRAGPRRIEVRRAQRRQVARTERGIRHDDAGHGITGVDAQPLIVAEEEQLVADERTADRAAEFVLIERVLRLRWVLEIVPCVQLIAAVVQIARSMERIRAALGHGNQNAAARFPVLGRHAVGFDPELLNRIDGRIERLAAEHRRGHRGAVENVVLIARPVAVDPQVAVVAAAVARRLLRDAGRERDQRKQIATGWQLLDLLLRHGLTEIGLLGLQQRRDGRHVDLLGGRTQLQRDVDLLVGVDFERDG